YRLKVLTLHMPPLRERDEDLPLLVAGLLERLARQLGRSVPAITQGALAKLQRYHWPGNVRELENVLTQALIHGRDGVLAPELLDLQDHGERPQVTDCLRTQQGQLLSLEDLEACQVQAALREANGHKGRACAILGISRPALARKIHKYGLSH
ncbi:MAG: helix-turn-helix domain-containing protein, partial [Candidatus Competibacteraceae bacterium]|nr:helix-turn-helix domain-containing protein [Candidatus Competibacteraceae bacterium]